MRATPRNYLKLLAIEAGDIREDVEAMIVQCEHRRKAREITEHVHGENIAVFRNLIRGVEMFQRLVERTDPSTFESVEAAITAITERFLIDLKHAGLFTGIALSIKRKMRKIQKTLEVMTEAPES